MEFLLYLTTKKDAALDDIEIVVPNCLQMGWCESPTLFCSSSEIARDVIQQLESKDSLSSHIFENVMVDTDKSPISTNIPAKVFTTPEVFVDDFIGSTNNLQKSNLIHLSRAMLHGVHSLFSPPDITNHQGEDPISQKKLHNGEGAWSLQKEILG